MDLRRPTVLRAAVLLGVVTLLPIGGATTAAQVSADPTAVGKLSPLIPFHKDAIHAGVSWTGGAPKICFWMRPSEYRGTDSVNPNLAPGAGALRPNFASRVYDGFGFSTGPNGLDESVATRIKADLARDNGLCVDLGHPDALKNSGKFNVADLTEADFALNAAAFSNAGHSGGLNYNIFCAGQVALADGRWLFIGGHDKSGNNGIRKLNVFDPRTQTWLPRPVPEVKADYLADPTGTVPPNADPRVDANVDPPHPSDMKYQRWYPTGVTLPDGRVLILSGSDRDASNPATVDFTLVRQGVPEVYDPKTDRTVALENAHKLLPMYPRAYVVQTGPRKDDWKVAVTGEVVKDNRPGGYDPFDYDGKTYLLDVQGALRDPGHDVRAEKHWTLEATAVSSHDSGAGAALWALDDKGEAMSQKVVLFGGGEVPDAVEMIDYAAPNPEWVRTGKLAQPASQNNAVVLPDGKVLVFGGATGRGGGLVNSFHLQLFDPASGASQLVGQTTVPRHDHSTGALLPDGRVIMMGGNRTDLVPPSNVQANRDRSVPVAQLYEPAYLHKGARPVINDVPDKISYAQTFHVEAARGSGTIASAVLIRMGPVTHNWDWGNRYVKLAPDGKTTDGDRALKFKAPKEPGLAVPGDYMLFVVDDQGIPSVAKRVHLGGGDQ